MIFLRSLKLFLLGISYSILAFQPHTIKEPQVQVQPAQKKSTWQATREGDLATLRNLLAKHPEWVNSRERKKKKEGEGFEEGLTPLAWAVLYNHFDIVKFLINQGANVNFKDNDDQTILHMAARTGNYELIKYLLDHGAKTDINKVIQKKGRTPLAEVLRASKDAIIHLSIEEENFPTNETFANALYKTWTKEIKKDTGESVYKEMPSALRELAEKESKKLSTDQIISVIKLLRDNGATANSIDATGRSIGYYINEVQLVSEPERIALLRAVGAPETPRTIQFNENNLPEAIAKLQTLANGLKQYAPNITQVIWAIQEAQKESTQKYNLLRVAMALLSKVKQYIHDDEKISKDTFKKLELHLDYIRTILRDSALLISGKAKALQPEAPMPAQKVAAQEYTLQDAIVRLQTLAQGLEKFGLAPQINNLLQMIQVAQKESNPKKKANILLDALELVPHVKEGIRKTLPDQFAKIETHLETIRKIIQNATTSSQQAQPAAYAAAPSPAPRILRNIIINSDKHVNVSFPGVDHWVIVERGIRSFNFPVKEGDVIDLEYPEANRKSTRIGTIRITKDGIHLEVHGKQPIVLAGREYGQFNIEISENKTLRILPA